jgi:hypothetical protein
MVISMEEGNEEIEREPSGSIMGKKHSSNVVRRLQVVSVLRVPSCLANHCQEAHLSYRGSKTPVLRFLGLFC